MPRKWGLLLASWVLGFTAYLQVGDAQASAPDDVEVQRPASMKTQSSAASTAASTSSAPAANGSISAAPTVSNGTAPPSAPAPPPSTTPRETEPQPTEPTQANHKKEPIPHRGFTMDVRIGFQGCVRSVCARSAKHHARPGFRIDGFIGGNIKGWVELGISGGWGTFGSQVEGEPNVLNLYDVDTTLLEDAAEALGEVFPFDLDSLVVVDSQLRTARGGPHIRIHFIPKGPFMAYVGSGVGYSLFRARYATRNGETVLSFHGIDVPIEAAFGYHFHKNVAATIQFDYLWSRYILVQLKHPEYGGVVPISLLTDSMIEGAPDIRKQLPHVWTVGFGIRARF